MKRKTTISTILTMMLILSIGVIGYAYNETDYTGYKDFLVGSHLVYHATYSDMFRPTETGKSKLIIDGNNVITGGDLLSGAEICNSNGTPTGSRPVEFPRTVGTGGVVDKTYSFTLSPSASYKAFLEPQNALHLYMNRVTIWYD